jgi:hypothetical protein
MEQVTPGWRFVRVATGGYRVDVAGVSVWEVEWGESRDQITVADPRYPQLRRIDVYRPPGSGVEFAAGEVSNGVWVFFEPDPADG